MFGVITYRALIQTHQWPYQVEDAVTLLTVQTIRLLESGTKIQLLLIMVTVVAKSEYTTTSVLPPLVRTVGTQKAILGRMQMLKTHMISKQIFARWAGICHQTVGVANSTIYTIRYTVLQIQWTNYQ